MERNTPFVISQTDGRPMYRQIMEHIQHAVAVGDWPAGFALPSIRELAADVRVSVITVKRAYQELERDGVIVTQHGKGSFVAERSGTPSERQHAELDRLLQRSLALGRLLGLTPTELAERLLAHASTSSSERT